FVMAIYPFCEDGQARELYTSRDLRQHTRQCCGKENFNSRECLLESARRRDEKVAERVGFEPTVRFPARSLSRRVLSTAQPPLRGRCRFNRSRGVRFSAIERSTCVPTRTGQAVPTYANLSSDPTYALVSGVPRRRTGG